MEGERRGGMGFGCKIFLIWKEGGEEGWVDRWNARKEERKPDVL